MQVILLEDVKSLGKKGDVVKVSDGYARNFILPKKLGLEATEKNLKELAIQKAEEEARIKREEEERLQRAKEEAEEAERQRIKRENSTWNKFKKGVLSFGKKIMEDEE